MSVLVWSSVFGRGSDDVLLVVVPVFGEIVKLELRTGQGWFGETSKELFVGMLVEGEGEGAGCCPISSGSYGT